MAPGFADQLAAIDPKALAAALAKLSPAARAATLNVLDGGDD
jgi:hypothetical protein